MNIDTIKNQNGDAKICIGGKNLIAFISLLGENLDLSDKEVEQIHSYAFKNVTGLRNIILPKSLQVIEESAFENCIDLKFVEVDLSDDKDLTIQSNAFIDCKNMDSVYIKCNKLVIEKDAFIGCSKLRAVVLDCSDLQIRRDSFVDSSETTIYGKSNISAILEKYYDQKAIKIVEVN